MPELSNLDKEKLLSKIRLEYKTYSLESPSIFSLKGFEERYNHCLIEKGNIENFLKQEILFFEELKKKQIELKNKRELGKGETFNKILEEQEAKISKYSKFEFHPMAKLELKYFAGAIRNFLEIETNLIYQIYRGTVEINGFQDSILQLERIGLSKKGTVPLRLMEHVRILASGNTSKIEQDSQNIIKDGCIALKKINDCILETKEKTKFNFKLNFKFNEKLEKELFDNFQNKSFESSLPLILNKILGIITDFRMKGIIGI